jgi:hypothetical protein
MIEDKHRRWRIPIFVDWFSSSNNTIFFEKQHKTCFSHDSHCLSPAYIAQISDLIPVNKSASIIARDKSASGIRGSFDSTKASVLPL